MSRGTFFAETGLPAESEPGNPLPSRDNWIVPWQEGGRMPRGVCSLTKKAAFHVVSCSHAGWFDISRKQQQGRKESKTRKRDSVAGRRGKTTI